MPQMFEALATYNAEVWRGIIHTSEYDEKMALLQRTFDEWSAREYGVSTRPRPQPSRPANPITARRGGF